jgi:hypothetical protein
MLQRAINIGTFRTRTAPMADFDLEALSLSELKKMQKDVEGGFHLSRSTKGGSLRRNWATLLPNLSAPR